MRPQKPAGPGLFTETAPAGPLAERMRPRTLDDVAGQEHLVGPHGLLRHFITTGQLPSMILQGPPGTGKTTIALLLAQAIQCRFEQLSATSSGVADVRRVLDTATRTRFTGQRTILFIDEIHRFNRSQQDTLLHAVEEGTITLIGATTENPSFELNSALLSRIQLYRLRPLDSNDLLKLVRRALSDDIHLSRLAVTITDITPLMHYSGGDARKALNALEAATALLPPTHDGTPTELNRHHIEAALQQRIPDYDKKGDNHYDLISAFIKSLRGSDPDAALYWLARMLEGGEAPEFITRRMIIFASEDIGNADPYAITLAVAIAQAVATIGMPEARIPLGQGVTYLATAPKSNASYLAIDRAIADVHATDPLPVPLHLCNAPTRLMKEEGRGAGYRYPHDYPGHIVEQRYFPDALAPRIYYQPGDLGRERQIAERLHAIHSRRHPPPTT